MLGTSDAPTEAGPAQQEKSVTFDEDGDLKLTVGTNPSQEMLVDSHVLCRTSPVFRKMLRGPFAERKPEQGNWNIKLPEDNNETFAVLMDLAHGLYIRVKHTIAITELYDLCVLTNKYNMVSVLRPMETHWYRCISRSMERLQCQTKCYRKAMFILFELGYEDLVRRMASELVRYCPTNVNGDFIDKNGMPLRTREPFNMSGISNILERVTDERKKTLANFKTDCHEFTRRALEGNPDWETFSYNPNICSCSWGISTNTILGNILSKAHELGLMGLFLPLATAPEITSSIFDLWMDISEIRDAAGKRCICSLMDEITDSMNPYTEWISTSEEEEAYMRGQAAKVRML